MNNYLITTAINYTNGLPHIGHCYEAIIADFIARFKRLSGDDVFFQTGTDEHGIKIAKTAEKQGISPKELCDQYAKVFRKLADYLNISYDHFIRTTDDYHYQIVSEIFIKMQQKNDIYLGEYEGWYLEREETFISELNAKEMNYLDTLTGKPLIRIKEPSFFFRLSKYQEKIIEYLENTPKVIIPEIKKDLILSQLKKEKIRDLSISRTNFSWGIPVPNDPAHCLYVWMDALFNYYSGPIHVKKMTNWLVNLHVIGKDIMWFHCVIWPALLMSAELPLPKQILVHDFIVAEDGVKMSKSLGNTIDLDYLLAKYPVETVRFYLLSENYHNNDLRFSETKLKLVHNSELADKIGNLFNRIIVLPQKYTENVVPNVVGLELFDLNQFIGNLRESFEELKLSEMISLMQRKIHQVNVHLVENKVWEINNPKYPLDERSLEERNILIKTYLEFIYIIGILWEPIQPMIANNILESFDKPRVNIDQLTWNNLNGNSLVKGLKKSKFLYNKF